MAISAMSRFGHCALILASAAAGIQPAAAQESPRFGPPVPGICLFGRSYALENSNSGKEIGRRIEVAQMMVSNQLVAQSNKLQAELASLPPNDTSPQISAKRMNLINQLNSLSQFQNDAQAKIKAQSTAAYSGLEPLMVNALSRVITRERCSVIIERTITYGWNNSMDITDKVIAEMAVTPGQK